MIPTPAAKRDTNAIAALLALSLLWALGSLRADLLPDRWQDALSSTLAGQALRLAVLAFEAALIARFVRSSRVPRRDAVQAALIGIGFFALPALLLHLSATYISDLTRAALFALTPVFAVVLEPYLGRANAPQSRTSLVAALVCVAGAFSIFPAEVPRTPRAFLALGAVLLAVAFVAIVNCRAVRRACFDDAPSSAATAAIAAATAAVALSLVSTSAEPLDWTSAALVPSLVWTTVVDLPALLLLFWLMRRMTAARMTLRFVLAPLFAGIFGLAQLRMPVGLRAALGLALMATGAAWMLLARDSDAESSESTLHLD